MTFGLAPFGTTPFAAELAGDGATTDVLTEGLVFSSTMTVQEVNRILEALALTGNTTDVAQYAAQVVEALGLSDRLTPVLTLLLTEDLALSAVFTNPSITVALVDTLILSGTATNTLTALAIISEALLLADLLNTLQEGEITEGLALADTLTNRLYAYERLVASLVFDDTMTSLAVFTATAMEALALTDGLTPTASLLALIAEDIEFSVGFVFDGTPFFGLSMNAKTRAIAEYSGYDLNSITAFNGVGYGAGPAGLYRLEGEDDAGDVIAWRVRTGLRRFTGGTNKRAVSAYLTCAANGTLLLKCVVVEEDPAAATLTYRKVEYWYEMVSVGDVPHQDRIKLGRGMESITWAFELAGDGTCPYSHEQLELTPLLLDRRIP